MPGTIRARATVSQPFSMASVSASASAAMPPTAKMRAGSGLTGFRRTLVQIFDGIAIEHRQQQRERGEGDRAFEAGDTIIDRHEDDDRRDNRRRRPQHRDNRRSRARLGKKSGSAEQQSEGGAQHEMRADTAQDSGSAVMPGVTRLGATSVLKSNGTAQCHITSATSNAAAGTAASAASLRQAMATVAKTSNEKASKATGSCRVASTRSSDGQQINRQGGRRHGFDAARFGRRPI